jgi:hypothetical protein
MISENVLKNGLDYAARMIGKELHTVVAKEQVMLHAAYIMKSILVNPHDKVETSDARYSEGCLLRYHYKNLTFDFEWNCETRRFHALSHLECPKVKYMTHGLVEKARHHSYEYLIKMMGVDLQIYEIFLNSIRPHEKEGYLLTFQAKGQDYFIHAVPELDRCEVYIRPPTGSNGVSEKRFFSQASLKERAQEAMYREICKMVPHREIKECQVEYKGCEKQKKFIFRFEKHEYDLIYDKGQFSMHGFSLVEVPKSVIAQAIRGKDPLNVRVFKSSKVGGVYGLEIHDGHEKTSHIIPEPKNRLEEGVTHELHSSLARRHGFRLYDL